MAFSPKTPRAGFGKTGILGKIRIFSWQIENIIN